MSHVTCNRRVALTRWLVLGLTLTAITSAPVQPASAAPDSRRFISTTIFLNRQPVANATVELYRNGRLVARGTTDKRGAYRFGTLDTGNYTVKASYRSGKVIYRGSESRNLTGTHMFVYLIHLQR